MPAKNIVKQYVANGHYHIYNRGVDKRDIFLDDQDYRVFLKLLKTLLSPPPKNLEHPLTEVTGFHPVRLRNITSTLHDDVALLAYCLMPNHFHLLISQKSIKGMPQLMRQVATSYSMYFNKKYKRVGPLFQGNYKAVNIFEDPYLLHVSRYIHLNPALTGSNLVKETEYPYSSYAYYLGKKSAEWVKPDFILSFFKSKTNNLLLLKDFLSYESFVEDCKEGPKEIVGTLALE